MPGAPNTFNRRRFLRVLVGSGLGVTAASLGLTFTKRNAPLTQFASDPHRPLAHFLPPANWMNDPNGLIEFQGEYHLFYQHNPAAPVWGDIHWGHAISRDLVRWTHLPVALTPTPNSPDEDGCWSGCAVLDDGVPTVLYTGVRDGAQVQCLARSPDKLRTWTKDPSNPVLAEQPAGTKPGDFRDPFVWRQGEEWLMVLGAALDTGFGAALLYRSANLRDWEYLHPLLEGTRAEQGWMWECPNFFPLRDKHVLLYSNGLTRHVYWVVGTFNGRDFRPETTGLLSADDSYAPLTFQDARGRRLLFTWIDEPRSKAERRAAGWAGLASLPRLLDLDAQGHLTVTPAGEVRSMRGRPLVPGPVAPDGRVAGVQGDALELRVEFLLEAGASCGLAVRSSPDQAEETVISYNRSLGSLVIDRGRSALTGDVERGVQTVALLDVGDRLRLTVFLDRSVLEVFVEGGPCVTSRIYPSRSDSEGVRVFTGNGAQLGKLDAWVLTTVQ